MFSKLWVIPEIIWFYLICESHSLRNWLLKTTTFFVCKTFNFERIRHRTKASLYNSRRWQSATRHKPCNSSIAAFDWCMTPLARSLRSNIFQTWNFPCLQSQADSCHRRWHCFQIEQSPGLPPSSTFASLSSQNGQLLTLVPPRGLTRPQPRKMRR